MFPMAQRLTWQIALRLRSSASRLGSEGALSPAMLCRLKSLSDTMLILWVATLTEVLRTCGNSGCGRRFEVIGRQLKVCICAHHRHRQAVECMGCAATLLPVMALEIGRAHV